MKIINKKTILSVVASLALSSSLFAQTDKVYAVVNGENITATDIAVALRDPRIKFDGLQEAQKKQVLSGVVEQKILAQKAFKSGIVKSAEFKKELEKVKQNLAYQMWVRDLSSTVKATDSEVKAYYEKNKTKFVTPMELKASHILLKTEKEADAIIKTLSSAKDKKAEFTKLAKEKGVEIKCYRIIYELVDDVKKAMSGLLAPDVIEKENGKAEVRETFSVPKIGTIGGSIVLEGKINRNDMVRLVREGRVVYEGKISSLRRFKDDAKEVASGFECGIGIENYSDLKVGDLIEAFVKEEVARELA